MKNEHSTFLRVFYTLKTGLRITLLQEIRNWIPDFPSLCSVNPAKLRLKPISLVHEEKWVDLQEIRFLMWSSLQGRSVFCTQVHGKHSSPTVADV